MQFVPFMAQLGASMQLVEPDYTSTFQSGETCVVLNNATIESPSFSGSGKRIPWLEISEAAIEEKGGKVWLVLLPGGPSVNRYGFFSLKAEIGRLFALATRNRIMLDLTEFTEPVREKLLNAINFQLLRTQEESVDEKLLADIFGMSSMVDHMKGQESRPWMTYGLIVANLVTYLFMLLLSNDLTEGAFGHAFKSLGMAAASEHLGERWKLVLSPFLHTSISCIFIGLAILCYLGPALERIYGRGLFILIYLGSAVIGNAASYQFAASCGASGAIFGLCGAITANSLLRKNTLSRPVHGGTVYLAWGFIVVSMILGLFESEFDFVGHAGGFLGGFLITLILPERLGMQASHRMGVMRPLATILLIILLAGGLTMIVKPVTEPIATASLLFRSAERYKDLTRALQRQKMDIKERQLSYEDADEQNRSIYVPAFRKLSEDISRLDLPSGDPKERFRSDLRRMSRLMEELLSIKTEHSEGALRLGTTEEARAEQIKREIADLSRYFSKGLDAVKKQ